MTFIGKKQGSHNDGCDNSIDDFIQFILVSKSLQLTER